MSAVSISRGASKTLRVTVKDAAGAPVNLTNATVYATVRTQVEASTAAITKVSTNAAQAAVTDGPGGICEVYFTPSDTSALAAAEYKYDVWVVLASGKRYQVISNSTFTVVAAVTVIA